jgi:hypothetical protein
MNVNHQNFIVHGKLGINGIGIEMRIHTSLLISIAVIVIAVVVIDGGNSRDDPQHILYVVACQLLI